MNRQIKSHLKNNPNFKKVFVKGEVSGVSPSKAGHLYFSLKDEKSSIRCVAFYRVRKRLKFKLEDGMQVLIIGQIDVFEERGEYEIVANSITEDGLGQMFVALEQLKGKLAKEGFFDPKFKKPLPSIPKRIGVVTSSSGDALKDILRTIRNKSYSCEIIIFPSLVQGKGSINEISYQISNADTFNLDCIIVGRGGGSVEDLWSFNSEEIARAVFQCRTPVISAVGHQKDETLIDHVADVRASTPTDAANKIIVQFTKAENDLNRYNREIVNLFYNRLAESKSNMELILSKSPFVKSSMVFKSQRDDFEKVYDRFTLSSRDLINDRKERLNKIKREYVIRRPCKIQLDSSKSKLSQLQNRLIDAMDKMLKNSQVNLDKATNNFNFTADRLITSKRHCLEKAKKSYCLTNPCQKQLNLSRNALKLAEEKIVKEMNLKIDNDRRSLKFIREKPIFKSPDIVYRDKSRQFNMIYDLFLHKSNELILNKEHSLETIKKSSVIKNQLKDYRVNSNRQLDLLNQRLEISFDNLVNQSKRNFAVALSADMFKNPEIIYLEKSDQLDKLKSSKIIKNPYVMLDSRNGELNFYREKLDKTGQVIELKKEQKKQKATYRIIIVAIVILMIIILFIIFGGI